MSALQSILSRLERNDPTLCSLCLRNSFFGISGLHQLVSALVRNKTLLSLNLSNNEFDSREAVALKLLLVQNKTLLSLDLGRNIFGPKGIEMLVDGLSKNESMQTLKLNNINISSFGARRLAVVLAEHKSLQFLDLRMCGLKPYDMLVLENAAAHAFSARRRALAELLMCGAADVKSALFELPCDLSITRCIIELAVSSIELLVFD
jgi:hypothetical protein